MAQYRTCVAAGIVLLAALVSGQPYIPYKSGGVYAGPSGIQTFYTGPSGANTPAVVIGSSVYVGTNQGVVGGMFVGAGATSQVNSPPINRTTVYPVTTLWNTSMTEMVAVANDTLHAFTGNISKWNFTSAGFQFDFAASMSGQYPSPLVYNNTIFIGTHNCNWVSGSSTGWSWVYAINLATGATTWSVKIPGAYTNYQIQLGNDLQTLVVRATTPLVAANIFLLNGATGQMLPFAKTTRYTSASNWLPQLALYNGTLWVNDYCGYIDVVNTTTNVTTALRSMSCTSTGFAPALIGDVVYVVASSSVYPYGAMNFSYITTVSGGSSGSVGTLQQVVQYTATSYIFCGPSGLQTYDTTASAFVSSGGSYTQFFYPYSGSACESLTWAGGLLVASFGGSVYAINVTAGTVAWQNQDSVVQGVGTILLAPTAMGGVFVMANAGSSGSVYTSALTWAQPAGAGWITASGLYPSGFAYFGQPYNVVVVQSTSSDLVTVLGAFNGSVLSTYDAGSIYSSDSIPVLVGDFACSNGYYYLYCVPLVSGKTGFRQSISGSGTTFPVTVSGSVLYVTTYSQIQSLDTSASAPTLTTVPFPTGTGGSFSTPTSLTAAVLVGKNAAGQAMLYGAGIYYLFGIKVATAATSWLVYTLDSSSLSSPTYGITFSTNVVQVPGDSNILVGGTKPPTITIGSSGGATKYGLLKFGATSHTYVDTYTFPSVTAPPAWLEVGPSIVIIVGASNLTACDQNGNRYWSLALGSSMLITSTNLQLGAGALFVAAYGTGTSAFGTTWYTINAYTGAIAWSNTQGYATSSAVAASVVNGLVFWGLGRAMVASLVTGQQIGNYALSSSGSGLPAQGGNSSTQVWVYGASGSYLYGVPINGSFTPAPSQQRFTGSFFPAPPSSSEEAEKSKLWIIAVVVAFLLVVIVIAVVVSRKKAPPKDQDYVAMNSQAGSV